jgi:DNA-binding response OmpR family regulator
MTDTTHILIVDDERRVRDMLRRYLEQEGFKAASVEDGVAMRRHISDNPVDLVLLDLVMPGEDGLSLSRDLRAVSDVPIIMLTGKGEPVDRVIGLEVGADDYITKPFHLREVLARIRSVLRRSGSRQSAAPGQNGGGDGERVVFAGWRLDLIGRDLRAPDGSPIPLTTGEFNLLSAFVKRPNRPLDRDQLMDLAQGRDWAPYDRSIDTQIGRLRKKLEADPKDPKLIKTVRGVGYVFTPKVERLG